MTFIFWGLFGFLPKLTTRYINPNSAIFYQLLIGLPMAIVVFGLMRGNLQTDPRGILLASLTGIVGTLGAYFFIVAVSRGPVSLVTAFTALYPAFTIILAMVFLGERLEPRQWVGVGTALIAMLLVAL